MSVALGIRGTLGLAAPARRPGAESRPETDQWSRRLISRRGLQVALGWLWLLDALLQLEAPNFARDFPLGDLAQSVMGGPAWENRAIFSSIGPFVAHWPWWNLASALLQASIGLALILGRRVRSALVVSVVWSAMIWLIGEGLGAVPTGFALALFGAPGAAALYGALAVLAWPARPERSTRSQGSGGDVAMGPWALCWSVYWIGAALLHLPWVYSAGQVFRAGFEESSSGQRTFLVRASDAAAHVVAINPVASAVVLGVLELSVAVGWLLDRHHRRRWLIVGIGLSVAFWVFGQALGEILNWGATDPSTAPVVILLALVAWPRRSPGLQRAEKGVAG